MSVLRNIKNILKVFTASVVVVLIVLVSVSSVQAAPGINKIINFQGKVTNANGTNVTDGTYDFVIKFYDGAGSGATNSYTETWSSAALWSSTMSSAPSASGESLTYSSSTNEATIEVGQVLWNTTKEEAVIVTSVNTGTNVIGISPTRQAWNTGDTVTNKIYVKDGTFKVAINSLNQDLSGVNFNTDNIFLGINFNSDGEMKPRIQYTAAPYAFNAEKVNGLTVTNTSDNPFSSLTTLKIGDGKTVIFNNTLTFSGTDSTVFTLPTTSGNVVTEGFAQSLTNKTIGSTGLIYSGATTDVTTGTNEDFVITPNGTGKIGLGIFANGPFGFFDIRSPLGTATAASISAQSSFAALLVDNRGVGDIFTASNSGATRFVIGNNGNLIATGTLTGLTGLSLASGGISLGGTVGTGVQCLLGGASAAWGSCGGGSSQWTTVSSNIYYATGNVGIGTISPLGLLNVSGAATGKALVSLNQTGNQAIFTASLSGLTKFIIRNDGNVGIGTTTPVSPFEIGSNAPDINKGAMFTLSGAMTSTTNNQYGIRVLPTIDPAGSAPVNYYGAQYSLSAYEDSTELSGAVMSGFRGGMYFAGTGTLGTGEGIEIENYLDAAGTISRVYGLLIKPTVRSAGTITVNQAIRIEAQTEATSNAGITMADAGGTNNVNLLLGSNTIPSGSYSIYNSSTKTNYFAGNLGIGTIAPLGLFQVDGKPKGKALAIFNQTSGGDQDLLVASQAGVMKFSVGNTGNIAATGTLTGLTGLSLASGGINLAGTVGSGSQCLLGGASATWGDCSGVAGTSDWTINNGTMRPNMSTLDVVFGGTSTASAKFSFLNLNSGTPVASFAGTLRLDTRPNSTATEQTTWTQVSGTAGTIGDGATTLIASVSASAIYNGSLYVGTYKDVAGGAEIYRYNGTPGSWTKVTQAAGTISAAAGATTAIGSVSAMTVFDGYLFAGTSKMNSAEIYRYEGGTTWTRVTSATPGSIGGVSAQDGVSSLAVYNGRMYAGTREVAGARVLRYDGGINNFTTLTVTPGTMGTNSVGVNAVTAMVVRNNVLYIGTAKVGGADVLRYVGGASATSFLKVNSATSGTFIAAPGSTVTAADEVTAMTVFNGNIVVGLKKLNSAELLVLSDSPTGVGVDLWSRLNNATGQLTNGGTANIDGISALTVYNGMLFVGTYEPNSAEVYRYVGADQKFMKVTQAAGTISATGGSTTGIDQITVLQPSNGDLYAGTMDLGKTEVYKYTANIDRSYGLEFHANPQIGGGEQNGIDNHASIYYVASASANLGSAAGNTGAIVFSHGIQTRNGSYDVAEDYPTRDDTLESGDLVSIDTNERGMVVKSAGKEDGTVIGVYSENPALRLSQLDATIDGSRAIPVALAGRVPVKVTTENGEIKSGDYLTTSSIPGVAMKALKAGGVIGQAMGGYSQEGVGKVMIYIKSASYNGSIAESFMGIDMTSQTHSADILAALASQEEGSGSEVLTDTLIAGLEIVTPKITADKIELNTLGIASGSALLVQLGKDGQVSFVNEAGKSGIVFDSQGNATFAGTVTADKIKANQIEGLEFIVQGAMQSLDQSNKASFSSWFAQKTKQSSVLSTSTSSAQLPPEIPQVPADKVLSSQGLVLTSLSVDGLATVSADLRVKGSGLIEGMLSIVDTLTARDIIVNGLANFFGKAIFKDDVEIQGHLKAGKDTAGQAIIKKGSNSIDVVFKKEYEDMPIINANIVLDKLEAEADQDKIEADYFNKEQKYVISKRSVKGFTIRLAQKADEDIIFSWSAFASLK